MMAMPNLMQAGLRVKRLPARLEGTLEPALRIKRDYNSTLRLCSFEAWLSPVMSGKD